MMIGGNLEMIYKFKRNRVFRSYFGGKRLDAFFGEKNQKDSQFPEEWIASTVRSFNAGREDIVEGPSICENGELLSDIISDDPVRVLGKEQYEKHGESLSVLVKLLDSAERLFIQCHPTIEFAKKHFNSNFGKTECWYILDCDDDACVYLGFKKGVTKEKLKSCFLKQDVEGMLDLMHKIKVKSGDFIFVDGGVPHAIGGGCMLCELQEPTDYMVIPERTSKSGITLTDKKMHCGLGFEGMFDCFVYDGYSEEELRKKYITHPKVKENAVTSILNQEVTDKFKMDYLSVKTEITLKTDGVYKILVVIDGNGTLQINGTKTSIKKGDEIFVTADSGDLTFIGNTDVLIMQP